MFNQLNDDMKKLFPIRLGSGLVAVLAALLLTTSGAAGAAPKKLPAGEAVLQARITMGEWSVDRDLSYPDKAKCQRKSRIRFRCTATVTGEFDRYVRKCQLVAIVVNRFRKLNYGGYWESVGRLTVKKCQNIAKPYLTDQAAKDAMKAKADEVAGASTTIDFYYRTSDTEAFGTAEWARPGEFGTESCSLDLEAALVDKQVKVTAGSPLCF